MKKIFALVLALMLVLGMTSAMADIKITLRSTATEQTQTNSTEYHWYELLKATINGNAVAYYLDSPASDTLKGLLATVTYENQSGETVTPFSFEKSADGTKWICTVSEDVDDNDGVALAAALNTDAIKTAAVANNTVTASGTNNVVITAPNAGYYLIVASNGKNLVLQTLNDVTIDEKNTYPPIDKTQGDEDVTNQNHNTRDVAVGDKLTYNVTVTVPASAKVGDIIEVWDKASAGLTFDNNLAVTPSGAAAATTLQDGDTWRQRITVTQALIGQTVTFSFTMTVNNNALVDPGKENETGLKYGNGSDWYYESKPVKVEYKTYFGGIHKVDGSDTSVDLEGVKFILKEAGTEFKVSKPTGADYYVPDANGSSEVVTDSQGRIMIRGLDEDKTYTLTETYTLPGYNPLKEAVTLTLHEDTYTVVDEDGTETTTTSFDPSKTNEAWGEVKNNKGSVLPSTGGIGTTLFYMGGGILVLLAIVMLVTKKRMKAED